MGLVLSHVSAWQSTSGSDSSTQYDLASSYDVSDDGSILFDQILATSHIESYASSGTRVSPPIDLSSLGVASTSSIVWSASTPTNTTLQVSTSIDGGTTWQPAVNGGTISGLSGNVNVNGKSLLIQCVLSTTDATVSPNVYDMVAQVVSSQTQQVIEYAPQGVFMLSAPTTTSKADGTREVTLQGDDKWHQFDGKPLGTFQYATSVATGTNVGTAIQTLAQQFGETKFAFDACSVTTPYTLTYQPGEAVGKAIKELAGLAVYSVFYDVNGYLRFRPINQNLTTSQSTWTYNKSEYTLYAGADKSFDESILYNSVLVIGGSSQTGTVSATSSITDPNNPISTVNIGTRLFVWNHGSPDPLISTIALAQARADYEIQQRARVVEQQKITMLPNFLQDAEDVITLVDDWTGTNGLYQVVKLDISLKPDDTSTGEVWRVAGVGS